MTRYLTESEGIWIPAPWRTDTSVPRTFLATTGDPARPGTGVLVADGDTWLDCTTPLPPPPPTYPPGPPGSYEPGPSTTGPAAAGYHPVPYPASGGPAGNIVNDVLTLADSGIDLRAYRINARVKSTGKDNILRGCEVVGGAAVTSGADVGLIDTSAATCRNFIIEDSEIAPTHPTAWTNCFRGGELTEQRNNVHGGCDNYDFFPATAGGALNVNRAASWAHDLGGFGPDSIGRVFSHNDIWQWTGGSGLTIVGCSDWGFLDPTIGQANTPGVNPDYPKYNSNSVALVTQLQGNCRGLSWTKSWAYGGGAALNFNTKGGTAGSLGVIDELLVGHDQYFQGGAASGDGVYGSGGDNTVVILSVGGFTFDKLNIRYKDNNHPVNTSASRIS